MWNVKAKATPVITGVNGTSSKSLKNYLKSTWRARNQGITTKSHIGQ